VDILLDSAGKLNFINQRGMLNIMSQSKRSVERATHSAQKQGKEHSKKGSIVTLDHCSTVLKDNPLGDPFERPVNVYLPAAYNNQPQKRFPVLFDLAGFTGSGLGHLNWRAFDENLPSKLDRLIANRAMPPVIVVFPDCFTCLGGNQYINSGAIGQYADYLNLELIPFVDEQLRTLASRDHRGCFGKSSGGYGALRMAMDYPQYWGGIANHSGDAYFDFVYKAEWPEVLTHLQKYATPKRKEGLRKNISGQAKAGQDDGRIRSFLEDIWSRNPNGHDPLAGKDIMALMLVAMAASYDTDPTLPNGFGLPFDLENGKFLQNRWRNWLRHDPIHMNSRQKKNLKSLKAIFIDCGWRDQFHIHYGSRQLSEVLQEAGVEHRYEEFNGTHSGVDHRLDISLVFLAKKLK
jgi:enterochelin esterase-like enzyme